METTNKRRVLPEKYDPLRAINVRDIKSTDIIIISPTTASTSIGTGDVTLASTATAATDELFLIDYSVSSTVAEGIACITVGNSTYLQQMMGVNGGGLNLGIQQDRVGVSQRINSPLVRVPVSTTVGLHFNCVTAGTVTGYAVFVRHPIPSRVETE